ncbi:MAG TPA: methyl-accepting chemotaxis protein, partial [Myxococcaceae bacterium]|nr:methyl-accepting chemotaxis protein [Myxococcaceae bacterium]
SGEAAIEMTMAGLNDIRVQVGEIAQKIVELGERTQQIGGITQTVKDLADQSHMLALNAAIEAVRSGEHGKGFSVVAREIRALADQSIQATSRVRELLDDISGSVTTAVRITERGAERMESGLTQVRASGQNLKELSNIVQDNANAVRQISAAVTQQNQGISQIFQAVNELSKMMDETVARIGSTGEAATTLQIISEQLSSAVKSYRVE